MTENHGLKLVIQIYKRKIYPVLEAHLESYRRLTREDAILRAAMAERYNYKKGQWNRHDHQRRLRHVSLEAAYKNLKMTNISECKAFHNLFTIIERAIGGIAGIGELMVYDTVLRIGANLGLLPDRVYIHSGARKGAENLGLVLGQNWIFPQQLPKDLQSLTPYQVEDLLCIYKNHLGSRIEDPSKIESLSCAPNDEQTVAR